MKVIPPTTLSNTEGTFTRSSTATFIGSDGLLQTASNNVLRIQYDATGACLGHLLEPAATNLLTYSEQFNNADWVKDGATVTANAAVAPDGTLTADKVVESITTAQHTFLQYNIITLGAIYTFSAFVKAAEWTTVQMQIGSGGPLGNFDLSAVTATANLGATAASITTLPGGWFRCTVTGVSNGDFNHYIYKTSTVYTGDGTSGIYIWGAQLEAGSFPTSYIPTTTAAATRAADSASMTGTNFSSWYNASQGTFVADANILTSGVDLRILMARNFGSTTSIALRRTSANGTQLLGRFPTNYDVTGGAFSTGSARMAGAYDSTQNALSVNGAAASTAASGATPSDINQLWLGTDGIGFVFLNGHIRRITYYPRRLSNAELQALTT